MRADSPTATATLPLSKGALLAIFGVMTLAALAPLFLVDVVPLANMPNHMARIRILAEIGQDPALAQNYRLNWGLQPNLAVDLLLTPLAAFVPPLELGRWFTAVCMLLLVGGTLALYRAVNRRLDFWPTALFLFVYNHVLIWGFLNFLFGLGLALAAFAAWIATADRSGPIRTAVFSLFGMAMFFVHLMSLGIYGLMVGAWEVGRIRERWPDRKWLARDWSLGALQFLPVLLLFLAALPPSVNDPAWMWGSAALRLRGILSPVYTNLNATDLILAVFVISVFSVGLGLRWIRPARGMTLPLVVLALLALAVPYWTYGRFGGVWGIDVRLWVAFAFIATACTRYAGPQRVGVILGAVVIGLFGARLFEIVEDWQVYDMQIAEYREAARIFEPGERIFQAQDRGAPVAGDPAAFQGIYYHLTNYSVLDRSVFLPTLFTDPVKQPVVAAPHLREIDTTVGWPVSRGGLRAWADPAVFDWFAGDIEVGDQRYYAYMWQDRFDHVVLLHDGNAENPVPELLAPVAQGSYFTIYRVLRGACTGDYPGACGRARKQGRSWEIPAANGGS